MKEVYLVSVKSDDIDVYEEQWTVLGIRSAYPGTMAEQVLRKVLPIEDAETLSMVISTGQNEGCLYYKFGEYFDGVFTPFYTFLVERYIIDGKLKFTRDD